MLANCALQPLAGKIYKEFSYKWTFLCFFGVFELGSLLCGAAASSNMFIIGRAVAGLGGAGLMNGALSIIAASVPLQKRPLYMGFMMAFSQLGMLFGPLIGGALTQYATWRWCFYINLPVGAVVAAVLCFTPVPSGPEKTESKKFDLGAFLRSLDLIGFALFAPAIIQLLLALQWGGTKFSWNSSTVIGLFCGGAATTLVFSVWEYFKGDDAMIPFSMVRRRVFWSSCLTVFFTFASMLVSILLIELHESTLIVPSLWPDPELLRTSVLSSRAWRIADNEWCRSTAQHHQSDGFRHRLWSSG